MPVSAPYPGLHAWRSEEQVYAAGILRFRNPIGYEVNLLAPILVCKTDDLGFKAGDEVHLLGSSRSATNEGVSVGLDQAGFIAAIQARATLPNPKTAPAAITIATAAAWNLKLAAIGNRDAGALGLPFMSATPLQVFSTEAKAIPGNQFYLKFLNPTGRKPLLLQPRLVNLVAEQGYVPGDIIHAGMAEGNFNTSIAGVAEVTGDLAIAGGNTGGATNPVILPKAGGTPVQITLANWRIFLMGIA